MWPLALWINSNRFAFANESSRAAWVWAAMNYLFAILAFLLARRSYRATQTVPAAQELGSYQLMSPIGEGGMGEVWRASHKMLARPAAIKLVKLDAGPAGAASRSAFIARPTPLPRCSHRTRCTSTTSARRRKDGCTT